MRKWSELSEEEQNEIEKRYKAGETPTDIAKDYNLKPKQISDQAYRKKWNAHMKEQKNTKKTAAKKTASKTEKKTAKKAAKKAAKKTKK